MTRNKELFQEILLRTKAVPLVRAEQSDLPTSLGLLGTTKEAEAERKGIAKTTAIGPSESYLPSGGRVPESGANGEDIDRDQALPNSERPIDDSLGLAFLMDLSGL